MKANVVYKNEDGYTDSCFMSVAERIRRQFLFNATHVPFFKNLYAGISIKERASFAETVKTIPLISKRTLREVHPYDLLPVTGVDSSNKLVIHRGTGGTTGNPVSVFYSQHDWKVVMIAHEYMLRLHMDGIRRRIVSFNNYNQGHISGPVFNEAVTRIGGIPITRSFGADDEKALKELVFHRCNMIIAPPTSTKKGGSLEDLLEADATLGINYINGDNIDIILTSSSQLTANLLNELKDLGVNRIINCYGSTEVMPVAVSCPCDPLTFHILEMGTYAAVVDDNLNLVLPGERGMLIVGRMAALNEDGEATCSTSTALLNYANGDETLLLDNNCCCGLKSYRIRQVERIEDMDSKLQTGCQVWE